VANIRKTLVFIRRYQVLGARLDVDKEVSGIGY